MTPDEIASSFSDASIDEPLDALNTVVMMVVKRSGCSWIEALAFIESVIASTINQLDKWRGQRSGCNGEEKAR